LSRFAFARSLSEAQRDKLRDLAILFLHEKEFSAAAGLELTLPMKLAIAAQACVLILELDLDYYRDWVGIIVYPEAFAPRRQVLSMEGTMIVDDRLHAGEAWLRGPLVLSWADVQGSGAMDGVNVVIHEFAHKLDMLNGAPKGFPPLHRNMSREKWATAFAGAFADFAKRAHFGEQTRIDPYAAESPAEFFAVMSEAFFEIPHVVRAEYPQLYEQLSLFYRQDPLQRMSAMEDDENEENAKNLPRTGLVAVWHARSGLRRGRGDGGP
jgi:Mlc titration factor MtfA (ptsG expression regulator)